MHTPLHTIHEHCSTTKNLLRLSRLAVLARGHSSLGLPVQSEKQIPEYPNVLCRLGGLGRMAWKTEDLHGFPNQKATVLNMALSEAATKFLWFGD
jgi:hypothetical protein